MKCPYCPKDLSMDDISTEGPDFSHASCSTCNISVGFRWQGKVIISIIWKHIIIGLKEYCIKVYPGPTGNAPEFVVYCYNGGWYEVIRWNFIPESWTPHNAADKLQTYLIFL